MARLNPPELVLAPIRDMTRSGTMIMRLLNSREVEKRTTLSRQTLWELRRKDRFPEPISLHGNRKAWVEDEVDAWIKERIAASRQH